LENDLSKEYLPYMEASCIDTYEFYWLVWNSSE